MYTQDGFLGQRLRVLSHPVARAAQTHAILRRLLVTDAGFFPHATRHGRNRRHGAPETVVIVCTGGTGWVGVDGSTPYRVQSGEAVVLAPRVWHWYRADDDDPWSIWWAHATGESVDDFVGVILEDGQGPVVRLHNVYMAVQCLDEAVSSLEADDTLPRLLLAAGSIWRLFAEVTFSRLRAVGATGDRIRQVQEFLRNNLDTRLSVPELAAMAGLSTSHFSALFKASAETSVKGYIKRLRSARARELLLTTNLPISQIAYAVGYQDALYFSRQFRAINGVNPERFRKASSVERINWPGGMAREQGSY